MTVTFRGRPLKYKRVSLTHEPGKPSKGIVLTKFDERAVTGDTLHISAHPSKVWAITKINGNEFHVIQTS